MAEACAICDRADCPTLTMPEIPAMGGTATLFLRQDCRDDCIAHRVDWRSRALAAEARIAKVRALAEQLENDPESWWCAKHVLRMLDGDEPNPEGKNA